MEARKESARDLIKRSFCELLLSKPYDDITVTDVVTNASVARVTYYRSYKGMDDILTELVEEGYEYCKQDLFPCLLEGNFEQLHMLIFDYATKMKQMNLRSTIYRACNAAIVTGKFEELICKNLQSKCFPAEKRYTVVYRCGIIISILHAWAHTDYQETPQQITDFIIKSLNKTR